MNETQYLTAEDVVALHDDALTRMGSPHSPLLHSDRLESAVAKPRNAAHYEEADLVRQAVVLAVGISQSQAFLDGNKRAALYAADVFLRINGLVFQGDPLGIAVQLEGVAEASGGVARESAISRLEAWLRTQVVPDDSFRP